MVIADFGISEIERCHSCAEFDNLIGTIDRLLTFCEGSRTRTHEYLRTLPEMPPRNLLMKMVEGVQRPTLYAEFVVHTQDQVFTPQEWNAFGTRCLQYHHKPAQLWLAIGANSTFNHLIECAAIQVSEALSSGFPWSHRSLCLLKQLIPKVRQHNPPRAQILEELGRSQKWITPSTFSSIVAMKNLELPLSDQDRRSLLDIAAILRNGAMLTEQEALRLWQFGDDCDQWDSEMRTEWLTLHSQIATRLFGSGYAAAVLNKLRAHQQLL